MFASSSTDIGSDLPLWAVQDDFKPGVATTTRFMGGWTKAYAKQYYLGESIMVMFCVVEWLTVWGSRHDIVRRECGFGFLYCITSLGPSPTAF